MNINPAYLIKPEHCPHLYELSFLCFPLSKQQMILIIFIFAEG